MPVLMKNGHMHVVFTPVLPNFRSSALRLSLVPMVIRYHIGEQGLNRPEMGICVDTHGKIDRLLGGFQKFLASNDTSVVDKDAYFTNLLLHFVHGFEGSGTIREV